MDTDKNSNKEKALKFLFRNSFKFNPDNPFPLASGIKSPYYIDCKISFSYPEIRKIFGELIYEVIPNTEINAIGGLALGAIPLAIAASDIAFQKGKEWRVFVVRKESKSHGLKKKIEGFIKGGGRAVIVDDVITTGSSTIEAIERSREVGLEIVKVVALIDREEEKGKEKINDCKVNFESIFTLSDFKNLMKRNEGSN